MRAEPRPALPSPRSVARQRLAPSLRSCPLPTQRGKSPFPQNPSTSPESPPRYPATPYFPARAAVLFPTRKRFKTPFSHGNAYKNTMKPKSYARMPPFSGRIRPFSRIITRNQHDFCLPTSKMALLMPEFGLIVHMKNKNRLNYMHFRAKMNREPPPLRGGPLQHI